MKQIGSRPPERPSRRFRGGLGYFRASNNDANSCAWGQIGEHARWLIGTFLDAARLAIFRRVTHPSASSKSSRSDSTFQVSLLAGDLELMRLKSAPTRIPGTSAMFSTQAKSHCRRRM